MNIFDINILTPTQLRLVNAMLEKPILFNMLDMGMGKTLSSLMALKLKKVVGDVDKILLISKPNIFKSWFDDNEKFDTNLKIIEIKGNPKQRLKIINSDEYRNTDIVCLSVFNIEWYFKIAPLNDFNCLVIDESSLFKNHQTVRFKTLYKSLHHFKNRYILNGTPKDSFISIYNQVKILDYGERLGKLTEFRREFQKQHPYIKAVWSDIENKDKDLIERIKDIAFNEVAKSEFSYDYIYKEFELTQDTKNKIELILDRVNANGEDFIKSYSEFRINYLKTLANDTKRLESSIKYIKNTSSNAIIVCDLVEPRYKLHELLEDSVIYDKNKNHIEQFNNGKIKYLLIHSSNISHGVNLQYSNAFNIYYYSPYGLGLDSYLQLNRRLARKGNIHKHFKIHHIYSKYASDMEYKNYKSLEKKKFKLNQFLREIAKG